MAKKQTTPQTQTFMGIYQTIPARPAGPISVRYVGIKDGHIWVSFDRESAVCSISILTGTITRYNYPSSLRLDGMHDIDRIERRATTTSIVYLPELGTSLTIFSENGLNSFLGLTIAAADYLAKMIDGKFSRIYVHGDGFWNTDRLLSSMVCWCRTNTLELTRIDNRPLPRTKFALMQRGFSRCANILDFKACFGFPDNMFRNKQDFMSRVIVLTLCQIQELPREMLNEILNMLV